MSANKFLIEASVSTRWGDMDAFNHVNNSVYATYLEEARLRWFKTLQGAWQSGDAAPVVAAMTMNFRRPIEWPAQLIITLFSGRVGRSSVVMPFRMQDHDHPETVYADGETTLVWINPGTGTSTPIPEFVREAL